LQRPRPSWSPWWPWLGVAAVAAGWVGFCLTFCLRTLAALWRFTPEQTAEHATTEDPSHVVVTATLILASLASVAGVGVHPGMTYHDSDTTLQTRLVRRAALGHALLSYLLGAVVLACTINLVVQLASQS
jgi:uncharacterized membrane protein